MREVPVDFFGNPRGDAPDMGAHEFVQSDTEPPLPRKPERISKEAR